MINAITELSRKPRCLQTKWPPAPVWILILALLMTVLSGPCLAKAVSVNSRTPYRLLERLVEVLGDGEKELQTLCLIAPSRRLGRQNPKAAFRPKATDKHCSRAHREETMELKLHDIYYSSGTR